MAFGATLWAVDLVTLLVTFSFFMEVAHYCS